MKNDNKDITCNVIHDLMPSYVDDICSEDSRKLVETHISECFKCNDMLHSMKNTEMVVGEMEKVQIDYFKRIRGNLRKQNVIGLFILAMIVVVLISLWIMHKPIPIWGTFLLAPVMVSAAFLCEGKFGKSSKKIGNILLIVAMAVIVYGFAFNQYVFFCLRAKSIPFNMEVYHLGPFLENQLFLIIMIELLVMFITIIRSERERVKFEIIIILSAIGINSMLAIRTFLYDMDTVIGGIGKVGVQFLVEALVMLCIVLLVNKRKEK